MEGWKGGRRRHRAKCIEPVANRMIDIYAVRHGQSKARSMYEIQ